MTSIHIFPGPVQSTDRIRYIIIHRMRDNLRNVQATNNQNLDQMYIYIYIYIYTYIIYTGVLMEGNRTSVAPQAM